MDSPYNLQYKDASYIQNGDVISWRNEKGELLKGVVKRKSIGSSIDNPEVDELPEVELVLPDLCETAGDRFYFPNPEKVGAVVTTKQCYEIATDSIERVAPTQTPLTYLNGVPIEDGDWVALYEGKERGFVVAQLKVLDREEIEWRGIENEEDDDVMLLFFGPHHEWLMCCGYYSGRDEVDTFLLEDVHFICREWEKDIEPWYD